MSTLPEKVTRILAPFGSLASLLRNRDKVASGSAGKLTEHDLTVVTGRGICRQWTLVAGLPKDYKEVADEAAMLALHVDSAETPTPRWVVPGDSCTRADDPGWRWHCISGNGTTLAEWERRPLAGALSGLAVSGHTHAISAVTGLQAALDDKQARLSNAAVLADISDVSGALAYKGTVISGSGDGELSLVDSIAADSPVALWPMTDASGALVDSIAGRNLTVSGSGTLTRQWSPLADESAVAHWAGNLVASHASILGIATPWTGSWTVEAAVMLLAAPGAGGFVLFQVGVLSDETEAGNAQVFLYVDSSRILQMIWEYGAGSNVAFSATSVPLELGRGYLVAARKDATAKVFQFLVNGRVVLSASYTQEPTGGGSAYTSVGANSAGGTINAALLGPVAIYGSALSLSRLRAHARAARLG